MSNQKEIANLGENYEYQLIVRNNKSPSRIRTRDVRIMNPTL